MKGKRERLARRVVANHLRRQLGWHTVGDSVSGQGLTTGEIAEVRDRALELINELALKLEEHNDDE